MSKEKAKKTDIKKKSDVKKKPDIQMIIIIALVAAITIVSAILLKDMLSNDNKPVPIEKEDKQKETHSKEEETNTEPNEESNTEQEEIEPTVVPQDNNNETSNYNISIIKEFNKAADKKNYLLSPYNIEIALHMLREGADGNTRVELDKVLGNRTIHDLSVPGIIGIANALFIKDEYKAAVLNDFYSILDQKYHSEVIYDTFTSPDKINNWVKVKTNGMIEKILDQMNPSFVMALASALAIDVKWADGFECINTRSEEFIKDNYEKINVEMMHKSFNKNAKYFDVLEAKGVVIPYAQEDNSPVQLEFIGILPKNDVTSYVNNLTADKLNDILNNQKEAGETLNIDVSLPRFKYDFNANRFIEILNNLGINDAFIPSIANFKKMINISENVYVGEAIHKTHIELNEVGTKAAAITYFGMYKNSAIMPQDITKVEIKFDKPFAYMIREKNSGEILFFGSVYEPNIWNGQTCDNAQ